MTSSVEHFRYLGICIGILVCIAGSLGNLLAIVAYFTNKRMKTAFNLLVVNLASVDFITSTTILPFAINGYFEMSWNLGDKTCEVFAYFYYAAHYTSAVFLVVISLNRFLHVSRPHSSYKVLFSVHRRRIIGILAWSFSPICLLPLLFTNGFGWWEKGLLCSFTRSNRFVDAYSLVMRVLFQLFPLLCMIVIYTMIFYTVKKSHASIDNPKITVEGCETTFTTETWTTAMSPTRSISKDRRHPYQLKLSFQASSPSKSPIRTPDHAPSLRWRNTQTDSSKEKLHPHCIADGKLKVSNVSKKAKSDDSSEYDVAILRKQSVCIRHALVCRAKTTENLTSENPSTINTHLGPKPVSSLKSFVNAKSRSVTFSHFDVLQESNQPSFPINDCKELRVGLPPVTLGQTLKSDSQLSNTKPRPRHLSVDLSYYPRAKYQPKGIRCASSLSLPNLKGRRHLSASLSSLARISRNAKTRKSRRSIQHAKAQRKLLYMCTVICSAFALCSLPSLLVNLITDYDSIMPEFHMIMSNLGWLTSLINPIVYAAMNVQFRREYCRILNKCKDVLFPKSKHRSSKIHPQTAASKQSGLKHISK